MKRRPNCRLRNWVAVWISAPPGSCSQCGNLVKLRHGQDWHKWFQLIYFVWPSTIGSFLKPFYVLTEETEFVCWEAKKGKLKCRRLAEIGWQAAVISLTGEDRLIYGHSPLGICAPECTILLSRLPSNVVDALSILSHNSYNSECIREHTFALTRGQAGGIYSNISNPVRVECVQRGPRLNPD